MNSNLAAFKAFVVLATVLLLATLAGAAEVKEVKVFISGGFSAALRELGPEFERATGTKVVAVFAPSMGETPEAIPNRLKRGEPADVLIMVGYALDNLIKQGMVLPGTRVDLAGSGVAMAVRAGAPKPDISSEAAFKRTLLAAKSIAYSDSASGVFLSKVLFPRLGVAEQIKDRARMIPGDPVGLSVARGEAELGFQQISELKAVPGIDLLGPLPAECQEVTLFSAAVINGAASAGAGRALVLFLASPAVAAVIDQTGLEAANR